MPLENENSGIPKNNTSGQAPKEIFEDVQKEVQNTIPQVQKDLMNKPTFKSDEKEEVIPSTENKNVSNTSNSNHSTSSQSPKNTKSIQKKSPNMFVYGLLGFLTFIITGFLVGLAYIVSQNNSSLLRTLGIGESSIPGFIEGINITFLFLGIIYLIAIFVAGAMLANNKKGTPQYKKNLFSTIFATICFVCIVIAYIPSLLMLSNVNIEQNFSPLEYISVNGETTGSAPLPINFDASKLKQLQPNLFAEWDFGDGSAPKSGFSVTHEYNDIGTFQVTLTVLDGKGLTQEIVLPQSIIINNVKANSIIDVDVSQGFAPLTVNFDASKSQDSGGNITLFSWNFGDKASDDNESLGAQAVHTYEDPGTYTVVLKVVDDNGEEVETKQTIKVLKPEESLSASIVASPIEGFAPLVVEFNGSGSSTGETGTSITKYLWNFGDTSQSVNGILSKHTYEEAGIYIATLTVTDNENNTVQEPVEITVKSELSKPIAAIVTSPTQLTGIAPFEVNFDGGNSQDVDGNITNYQWDIGEEFTEYGENINYVFETPGEYIVRLTVLDNDGNESSRTTTITVNSPGPQDPVAIVTTTPNPPQAVKPADISFDASESYDVDGTIISYSWDFGDGSPLTQTSSPRTSHTYDTVGVWPATVTVYDDTGATTSTTIMVAINTAKPVSKISVNQSSGIVGSSILFTGTQSTGQITDYMWNFGDGTTARGAEVEHVFNTAGTYNVTLTVSAVSLTDTTSLSIVIEE